MKKYSKFSYNVLQNIRKSDEFVNLVDCMTSLQNQCEQLAIKSFAYRCILALGNLKSGDMLGFVEQSDFDEFYKGLLKNKDELARFVEIFLDDKYNIDVQGILASMVEFEEINDED